MSGFLDLDDVAKIKMVKNSYWNWTYQGYFGYFVLTISKTIQVLLPLKLIIVVYRDRDIIIITYAYLLLLQHLYINVLRYLPLSRATLIF